MHSNNYVKVTRDLILLFSPLDVTFFIFSIRIYATWKKLWFTPVILILLPTDSFRYLHKNKKKKMTCLCQNAAERNSRLDFNLEWYWCMCYKCTLWKFYHLQEKKHIACSKFRKFNELFWCYCKENYSIDNNDYKPLIRPKIQILTNSILSRRQKVQYLLLCNMLLSVSKEYVPEKKSKIPSNLKPLEDIYQYVYISVEANLFENVLE